MWKKLILDNNLVTLIDESKHTLIIEDDNGIVIQDNRFGVICLVENFDKKFGKVNVYDKLIGKGAALMLLSYNLQNVYAKTITKEARKILEAKCNVYFSKEVDHILNRDRSDLCPIEKIAEHESDINILYNNLKNFYLERGYLND